MNIFTLIAMVPKMLFAPLAFRRMELLPPKDAASYEIPSLASAEDGGDTCSNAQKKPMKKASDIPKKFSSGTPKDAWPEPFLSECTEPIQDGAPDLRGVWIVHKGPLKGHIERIEQSGNRVTITCGGLVHDMFADGTLENGVNDVAEGEGGRKIQVAARFEDERLNLYPGDLGFVAVTRYLEGDEMRWRWGLWSNRLRRLTSPEDAAQS